MRITTAWWLRLYLSNVFAFARLMGMEPDMERVGRMLERGIRVEQVR